MALTGPYTNEAEVLSLAQSTVRGMLDYLRNKITLLNTGIEIGKVPGSDLGTPANNVIYYAGAGSYTTPNNGTFNLTQPLNYLFWDGTNWTYLEVPIDADAVNAAVAQAKGLFSVDRISEFAIETNTLIPNNTSTTLQSTTISNNLGLAVNGGQITVQESGAYKINARVVWASAGVATAVSILTINSNGNRVTYDLTSGAASGNSMFNTIETAVLSLEKDDVITFVVYQNTGAPINLSRFYASLIKIDKAASTVKNTTVINAAPSTTTYIPLTQVDVDRLAAGDGFGLTVRKSGKYLINASLLWNYPAGAQSFFVLALNINGNDLYFDKQQNIAGGTDWSNQLSVQAELNQGDVLKLGYFTSYASSQVSLSTMGITLLDDRLPVVIQQGQSAITAGNDISIGDTITITEDGYYLIDGYVNYLNNTARSDKKAIITVDGAYIVAAQKSSSVSGQVGVMSVIQLTKGQVIGLAASTDQNNVIAGSLFSASVIAGQTAPQAIAQLSAQVANNSFKSSELSQSSVPPLMLLNASFQQKKGVVLDTGTSGFDAGMVESPCIWYEPSVKKYVMIYTGYNNPDGSANNTATIGYAYSEDLLNWQKQGVFFAGSGIAGAPDSAGTTGPVLVIDHTTGVYHLFYIGLTSTGYEAGTKTLCHAYKSSYSATTWTRVPQPVISPSGSGWRSKAIWHANFVKKDEYWYLFFNATGADDIERAGYAKSRSLYGPWAVDDTNSPLLDIPSNVITGILQSGDPSLFKVNDMWIMSYATQQNNQTRDDWAFTTDDAFPLGWQVGGIGLLPGASYDSKFAHKPFIIKVGSDIYHYYTAVDSNNHRCIALAIAND